jgi:hypothetical protein
MSGEKAISLFFSMKTRLLRFALSSLAAGAALPVMATQIDQFYAPSSFYCGYSFLSRQGSIRDWSGQTFTAGLTGQLTQIDLPIWQDPAYNTGLTLDIFSFNGTSLGTLLGSVTIPSTSVPDGQPNGDAFPPQGSNPFALSVALSGLGINVTSGNMYAIAASATALYPAGEGGNGILWLGSDVQGPDNYTSGNEFFTYSDSIDSTSDLAHFSATADLGFKTYVAPVPEPSSLTLLALGGAVVLRILRKRHLAQRSNQSPFAVDGSMGFDRR